MPFSTRSLHSFVNDGMRISNQMMIIFNVVDSLVQVLKDAYRGRTFTGVQVQLWPAATSNSYGYQRELQPVAGCKSFALTTEPWLFSSSTLKLLCHGHYSSSLSVFWPFCFCPTKPRLHPGCDSFELNFCLSQA